MKIELDTKLLKLSVIGPKDGWVRVFGRGIRWKPATRYRLLTQRGKGVVLAGLWFGYLPKEEETDDVEG